VIIPISTQLKRKFNQLKEKDMNKFIKNIFVFVMLLQAGTVMAFISFKSSPIDQKGKEAQYICPTSQEGAYAIRIENENDHQVWSVEYQAVVDRERGYFHMVNRLGTDLYSEWVKQEIVDGKTITTIGVGLSKKDFSGDPVFHEFNKSDLKLSVYADYKEGREYILVNAYCLTMDKVELTD
jgi:hypothetical protein